MPKTVATIFTLSNTREYMNVGVAVNGSTWWNNAMQANVASRVKYLHGGAHMSG